MTGATPGSLWSAPLDKEAGAQAIARQPFIQAALHQNFRVVRVERGGMGEVFICESASSAGSDKTFGFALKTFQKRFFFDFASRAAFLDEATTWLRLTGCLNIMPALGLETLDQRLCVRMLAIVSEEGGPVSVRDMLNGGPLAPSDVLAIALQVAMGMRQAGERISGLIHGDLKPDNLLLMRGAVWISDFGLARVFDPEKPGLPMQTTYSYQAPEVFDDPSAACPAADIYSFGIMLYELLTGACPVQPEDRESAARAHRELSLAPLDPGGADGTGSLFADDGFLVARLSDLALDCARKAPSDRPQRFDDILTRLNRIASEYDPVEHLDKMMVWCAQQDFLKTLRRDLAPTLVHSLFQIDQPKFALDLLEDIEEAEMSDNIKTLKATALSLCGQEGDAVGVFEKLLTKPDLDGTLRLECEVELALALKRLGRYAEAIARLEPLQWSVPENDLPIIVVNLATVYLESNDNVAAVELLRPFCRRFPKVPDAWGNLGISLACLARAEEALEALDMAIAQQPSHGGLLVWRAKVLMDLMGQFELAFVSLDMAFDQGYESREWLVRSVVAALATGRKGEASAMMSSARTNLGDELADKITAEVQALIGDLHEGVPDTGPRYKMFLARDAGSATKPAPARKAEPAKSEADTSPHEPSSGFKMPFMNTRLYMDDGSYSLDFYLPIETPNYVETFERGLRDTERVASLSDGKHLRGTPFFVTVCPSCGLRILTNRDAGRSLCCRGCDTRHACAPYRSELTDGLVHRANRIAHPESDNKHYLVLALQGATDDDDERIAAVCGAEGFRRLTDRSLALSQLTLNGMEQGTFDRARWILGFISNSPMAGIDKGGPVPPGVDRVLRRLRSSVPRFRSSSMSLHPDDQRFRLDLDPEWVAKEIASLSAEAMRGTIDLQSTKLLVEFLRGEGRYDEALGHSRRLCELTPNDSRNLGTLGALELQVGNVDSAIAAFRRLIDYDPANAVFLSMLGHAYTAKGDIEMARRYFARAQSLGGPMKSMLQQMLNDL